MKATFDLSGGIHPKPTASGKSYVLYIPETVRIRQGHNAIRTGVLIRLPKNVQAWVTPIPEHAYNGIYGHDADVPPVVMETEEITIPVYNNGEPFFLKKGMKIAILTLTKTVTMKRQITMRYAAGDILAVVKENCDKVSAATHGAETLWSIDYTFRKKKKFLMVSTTDKAQTAIFRIMAIKKNAYVIDTGLAGYPPAVCRTAIEKITRKIKGNEDF